MRVTRRDLMLSAGGALAALPFTPLPWKLLDDVSIWTQNWPWIPAPQTGELRVKHTSCTLCPAGCGMNVRCIDGRPIGVMPVAHHPVSCGTLCPIAFGAHQLPWHPRRLKSASLGGRHASVQQVAEAVAENIARRRPGETVAVLDERPGRAMSVLYRRFLGALDDSVYLTPRLPETATLDTLRAMSAAPSTELGYDFEHTRTILSFGAPVLDGWGTPGRLLSLWKERRLRVIHAESRYSHTAMLAGRWLPLLPGSEAALALGLASVLLDESLSARAVGTDGYRGITGRFTLDRAAGLTGLRPELIREVARELAQNQPALVIGGGDPAGGVFSREAETAIAALNVLLGSVGREGGIVARRPMPAQNETRLAPSMDVASAANASIRVLIADAATAGSALPWKLIEPKLAPGALVVSLSPYQSGYALRAGALVPTPAFLESLDEAPTPPEADRASFALAPPVLGTPEGVIEPAAFLSLAAEAAGLEGLNDLSLESALRARAETIFTTKRGTVFSFVDGGEALLATLDSADALWDRLSAGAVWIDERAEAHATPRCTLPGIDPEQTERLLAAGNTTAPDAPTGDFPLVVVPAGWRGATGNGVLPPLATKLDQESLLRPLPRQATVHPVTAARFLLRDGARIVLESPQAQLETTLTISDDVMQGVVELAIGEASAPGALDLFAPTAGGAWRAVRARIGRA